MSEQIVNKFQAEYTIVPNSILKNANVSLKAKGLMCYLVSLPKDWKIYKSELVNHSTDGKDAIDSAFKELIDLGYITQTENPKIQGKFAGNSYTVADLPLRINRSGKTVAENPQLLNTNKQNTNKQKINTAVPKKPLESSFFKQKFLEFHLEKKGEEYFWSAKDGSNLLKLIQQVKFKLTSFLAKNPDEVGFTEERVQRYYSKFLEKSIEINWIKDNLSISNLHSKFNEIDSRPNVKLQKVINEKTITQLHDASYEGFNHRQVKSAF